MSIESTCYLVTFVIYNYTFHRSLRHKNKSALNFCLNQKKIDNKRVDG